MGKIYKIIVTTEERENPETNQKFNVHHAFDKNNKKVTVKFTKKCNDKPGVGRHEVVVDSDNANMDYTGRYVTMWVNKVEAINEPEKRDGLDEVFGN